MTTIRTYSIFETQSLESTSPMIEQLDWSDITEFFKDYYAYVGNDSGYGHVTSEEFAEIVADMLPSTLANDQGATDVGKYFAALATNTPSPGGWPISQFDLNMQHGYAMYVKFRTKLDELNAVKLLAALMNAIVEDTSKDDQIVYFFNEHVLEIPSMSPTITAGTVIPSDKIITGTITTQTVTTAPKKVESDFI